MRISDFFANTLGANLTNSRWSWGASNPNTNQLFLRIWEDEIDMVGDLERCRLLKSDWAGASPGFPERKRHIDALRNGAEGYGVVCIAKYIRTSSHGGTQITTNASIQTMGFHLLQHSTHCSMLDSSRSHQMVIY